MKVRFYIDRQTGLPHIYKHNVTEAEVKDILIRASEDRPGHEGARIVIGQTKSSRYLRVIYVPDPASNSVFVITAYDLTGKALLAYRKRIKRRQGK